MRVDAGEVGADQFAPVLRPDLPDEDALAVEAAHSRAPTAASTAIDHRARADELERLRHLGRVPAVAVEGRRDHRADRRRAPPACRGRAGSPLAIGSTRVSACAAISSSPATICSTFSTIVRALRPHQVEFETWSSALHLPGIESTEPGRREAAVLHHQRRHRALHGGEAGVEAALAGQQVARQAVAHGRVDEAREAALGDRAEIGHGDGEDVHRLRHVLAVEMAAGDRHVAARAVVEDQRVVGRGVDLGADDALDILDRLDGRPVHLRRAAQRVDVLHARRSPACRAARGSSGKTTSRAACEQRFVPSRMRRRLRATFAWPGCGRAACRRGSKAASSPRIASSDRARAMSACFRSRRASCVASTASASDTVEPLMSAEASFAPSVEVGLEARLRRSPRGPAGACPCRSISASSKPQTAPAMWARGARSPEAPTEPFCGMTGCRPALRKATSRSTSSTRGPGIVRGEGVGAQQHHRPRDVLGEGLADAGRVGVDGLALVGRHVGDRGRAGP